MDNTSIAAKRNRERALIEAGQGHGEHGHLNVRVRDQESDVTGYGKHNRLVVFGPCGSDKLYEVREDRLWGLPDSTEADRQKVLSGWQRQHPKGTRLQLTSTTDTGGSVWFEYEAVPTGRRV